MTTREPPVESRAVRAAKAAAAALTPMRLWPQAWPTPGRASYSARKATRGPPWPAVARKAVGRPQIPLSTWNPAFLQEFAEPGAGLVLLEARLWVVVDAAAQVDELLPVDLDLGDGAGFETFLVNGHRVAPRASRTAAAASRHRIVGMPPPVRQADYVANLASGLPTSGRSRLRP